jgi:non-specific serine/threonine protein kinase
VRQAFGRGAGHGLLRLGAAEVGQVLPPVFAYWRELGNRYVTALCTRPGVEEHKVEVVPSPAEEDLASLASAAPVMPGAEY